MVGIHIRGTDMKSTQDHPIPPHVLQFINALDNIQKRERISKIFLCTDEESIVEQIRNKYGNMVVCTTAYRSDDGESIHKGHNGEKRQYHHYLMGREVLVDALVLSQCEHLICGHSNVAYAAILFNANKYKTITLLENQNQNLNTKTDMCSK